MKLPNIFETDTQPENFAAGSVIFQEGQPGDTMYIVKGGEVEVRVRGKVVEVIQEDGFFGELAVIEDGPRSATAIARTDCVLIPLDERKFDFMIHANPLFAREVMRQMARRLRGVNEAL